MGALLDIALSLPTVLFTVPLVLVSLYWLLALVGLLDLGGEADGLLDGAVDGMVDGAAAGALDVDAGGAADLEGSGCLAGVLGSMGLIGVPLTISLSLLVFFSWLASLGGSLLGQRFGLGSVAAGGALTLVTSVAVALAAFGVAVVLTAVAIRPLKPFFHFRAARKREDFVGSLCTVRTSKVDGRFGQAEIDDGGAGLLVEVRCPEANDLRRGSKALIFDYDSASEVFLVTPAVQRALADLPPEQNDAEQNDASRAPEGAGRQTR